MDYVYYNLLSWWIIPIPPASWILSLFSGWGCLFAILLLPIALFIALLLWPPFWYFFIGLGIISVLIDLIKRHKAISSIIGCVLLAVLISIYYGKRKIDSAVETDMFSNNNISSNTIIGKYDNSQNTWLDAIKNEDYIIDESKNNIKSITKYPDTNLPRGQNSHRYPARICVLRDTNYLFKRLLTSGAIIVNENNYPYVYIESEDRENDIKINVMYHDGKYGTIVGTYNWNGKENEYEASKFKKWMYSNVFE